MKLSKNFSLQELTKSSSAIRLGLDNTPGDDEINNLRTLCEEVLQPVRDYYGMPVVINSGYRSPQVNAAIGGSRTSEHCKGMAADIEIPGIPNADLATWIKEHLRFRQLILEFYTPGVPDSGWVHVSFDPADLKQEIMTASRQGGKTVYLHGLVA